MHVKTSRHGRAGIEAAIAVVQNFLFDLLRSLQKNHFLVASKLSRHIAYHHVSRQLHTIREPSLIMAAGLSSAVPRSARCRRELSLRLSYLHPEHSSHVRLQLGNHRRNGHCHASKRDSWRTRLKRSLWTQRRLTRPFPSHLLRASRASRA